jgi:hypothetical protein
LFIPGLDLILDLIRGFGFWDVSKLVVGMGSSLPLGLLTCRPLLDPGVFLIFDVFRLLPVVENFSWLFNPGLSLVLAEFSSSVGVSEGSFFSGIST